MSLENWGMNAGSGFFGALIAYFGLSKRLDNIEKKAEADKAEASARIEAVEVQVLYKDVHAECSRAWHERLDSMDKKLDIILTAQRKP